MFLKATAYLETESGENRYKVLINTDLIATVEPTGTDNRTWVIFSDGHGVVIDTTFDQFEIWLADAISRGRL